jgi:AraC family transcriptional regulator
MEQALPCVAPLPPPRAGDDPFPDPLADGSARLPTQWVHHRRSERHLDHFFVTPVVALWARGHNEVDVRRSGRRHWPFQGHAGRLDYWPAGEYAAILCGGGENDSVHVALPPEALEQCLPEAGANPGWNTCRFQFADPVLRRLVLRLAAHAQRSDPLDLLYTDALSAAIVQRLAARMAHGGARVSEIAALSAPARRRVADLVEAQLDAPPGLADMALAAGMRTATFLKAFRAAFGLSPHQYLMQRRVERAKAMLQRDDRLVDIAQSLGFASHAHFSGVFSARTGLTPSAWRRAHCR